MSRIDNILDNLPEHWNKSRTSKLSKIINAITDEMSGQSALINRIDLANDIDTATGIDLDNRWGKILNINRYYGEVDDDYRKRLKISISILAGGTAEAIKFAVCSILNTNNTNMQIYDKVHILDAWEYTMGGVNQSPGNSVCIINIDDIIFNDAIVNDIMRIINKVKASGIKVHFIFVITYSENYEMNDVLSDNDDISIDYPNIECGFTLNQSMTNIHNIVDGTILVETCNSETNDDILLDINTTDEYYRLYRPTSSLLNKHMLNDSLYTSSNNDDNTDIVYISDYYIECVDLCAIYNDSTIMEYIESNNGFILNNSETNIHIISDNNEHAIICMNESGMDIIMEDNKPDIIIKY